MKLVVTTLLTFLITEELFTQNLVPNPSFEDAISCDPINGIFFANSWINPTGYSPDYYNSCWPDSINNGVRDVPFNAYGHQYPRTGNAYMGLITAFFGFDGREYIQCELSESLARGQKYSLEFHVCLTDSSPFAVNNIGAYISDTAISSSGLSVLHLQPQIENDVQNNPLDLFDTWIKVKGIFIAAGGEKYLTIGNFIDDLNTDTSSLNSTSNVQFGYYFIDDVSIEADYSTNAIEEYHNHQVEIQTVGNVIKIRSSDVLNLVQLFELNGQMIQYLQPNTNEVELQVKSESLFGIYVLRLNAGQTFMTKKLFFN